MFNKQFISNEVCALGHQIVLSQNYKNSMVDLAEDLIFLLGGWVNLIVIKMKKGADNEGTAGICILKIRPQAVSLICALK